MPRYNGLMIMDADEINALEMMGMGEDFRLYPMVDGELITGDERVFARIVEIYAHPKEMLLFIALKIRAVDSGKINPGIYYLQFNGSSLICEHVPKQPSVPEDMKVWQRLVNECIIARRCGRV